MTDKANSFLPVSLNVRQRRILIVGGGQVAMQKLESLKHYNAEFVLVAPRVHPGIPAFPVRILLRSFRKRDLKGVFLVYSCTDNAVLNSRIRRWARIKGILVNVVDNPKICDFVSPAIYRDKHMTVAVSSDAKDVKQSIAWRNRIKEHFEYDKTTSV